MILSTISFLKIRNSDSVLLHQFILSHIHKYSKMIFIIMHLEFYVFSKEILVNISVFKQNKMFIFAFEGGRWDLDSAIIRTIEEKSVNKTIELDDGENNASISVMALAAGKLWCGIKDII
jgi:hypothetical protein